MRCKLCVFFLLGLRGGVTTLSYRLGEEYRKRGYEVAFCVTRLNDEKNFDLLRKENFFIIHETTKNWWKVIKRKIVEYDEIILWGYNYEWFYILEDIKTSFLKDKNRKINIYLYAVLDKCLVRGGYGQQTGIKHYISQFVNALNKPYVQYLYNTNRLIMMDELVVETTERFLKVKFRNVNDKIFRLPMDIEPLSDFVEEKPPILITMARFEFPFKGYILGLIDVYSRLKKNHSGLELWIIGSGFGESEIKKKIQNLNLSEQEGIKFLGNIAYSEVGDILKQGKVFIGMGTGVLDAAARKIPSIPIQAHIYECKGKSFFHENPKCVGYGLIPQCDENLQDITKIVESVLEMDSQAYQELCNKEWYAVYEYYSMEMFMNRINSFKNIDETTKLKACKIGYMMGIGISSLYHRVKRDIQV